MCKDFSKDLFNGFKNALNKMLVKSNFRLEKYLIGKQCRRYDLGAGRPDAIYIMQDIRKK
jgi:hypothetical protein